MRGLENLQVLFEDNHLIAVNKPAGMLVHSDETGDRTLVDMVKLYIKIRYDKPGDVFLGVIHRLDRPVSGLVVFARTSKGLERMNKLFQKRTIKKTYMALTVERPKPLEGELEHYISKHFEKNIVRAFTRKQKAGPDAKHAKLKYKLLASIGDNHLVKVEPITGRHHQIRVQLAKMKCSIRGDIKYGAPSKNRGGYIHLHSYKLEFEHPVKKEPVTIIAPLPYEQVWNQYEGVIED